MNTLCRLRALAGVLSAGAIVLLSPHASAQITNVLFSDDFSAASIDATKYVVDSPFFEGGIGDIAPKLVNGQLQLTGTVSQQWWAGATLRVLQTFPASPETNIVVSVDRVAELGQGSASRSALWIMDFTRTRYVLFADVRGEGGWRYNRYIGETGDVRTGGGTDIVAFNGTDANLGINFDDQGEHRMAVVINGQNVKLYLDGKLGDTVKFPFSPVVVQLGSYARAQNDTADTTWDNLRIESVGTATFSISALTMGTGQTASNLVVRIPPGANANADVVIRILNRRPTVANLAGSSGGTLSLTFAKGGPNTQTFNLNALAIGNTQLTITNSVGLLAGNALDVIVTKGTSVLLEDDFSGTSLDTSKWQVSNQPFETSGMGTFQVAQQAGTLQISGAVDGAPYWPGASIMTVSDFTASKDLPLQFEIDRISMDPSNVYNTDISTGARTGVYITSYDNTNRITPYILLAQDLGSAESPTNWTVNVSSTGAGLDLTPINEGGPTTGNQRLKIRADGTRAEVYVNDILGGTFDFPAAAFIKFEVAAYARDFDDAVKGVFDNAKIQNVLPCITVAPTAMLAIQGDSASSATVTIPKLLNVSGSVKVTVTSRNPSVAEPAGAANGSVTLDFPTGTTAKGINIVAKSAGNTIFDITNDAGACVASSLNVSVTTTPQALLSDSFSAPALDQTKWNVDTTPLVEGGALTSEAAVVITNGTVQLGVISDLVANWPGYTVWTKSKFTATESSPVVFEIDRVKMDYVLVGGNTSKQRVGVWLRSGTNYVFFSELGSYDATSPGWQFHRRIGKTGDMLIGNPDTSGTYVGLFGSAQYLDQKNHRIRMVVNGTSAKLYLDGVLGTEVAFPYGGDLEFGFGAYANFTNSQGNIVNAFWDNAAVQGFPAQPDRPTLAMSVQGGKITLTYTGTLQESADLKVWTNTTGATSPFSAQPAGGAKFYRTVSP